MSLQLVNELCYSGSSGLAEIRNLQLALSCAFQNEDWAQVRKLDQTCAMVIDKVIAANNDDGDALVIALKELKGLYASLIVQCKREVASMTH